MILILGSYLNWRRFIGSCLVGLILFVWVEELQTFWGTVKGFQGPQGPARCQPNASEITQHMKTTCCSNVIRLRPEQIQARD